MKQFSYYMMVVIMMTTLTLSCTKEQNETDSQTIEDLHKRLRRMNVRRQYAASEALIDSAVNAGLLKGTLADGERGSLYVADHQYRQGEALLLKAIEDESLASEYRRCYLDFAEVLVLNKIELHKWEEALRLAERFCSETRNSTLLPEKRLALQMYANIGSCMIHLYNFDEASVIGENVYNGCLSFETEDPESAMGTFKAIITFYDAYEYVSRWKEADLWLRRALETMNRIKIFTSDVVEFDHWWGYLHGCRSVTLYHLGHKLEAAEAFHIFESTKFSKGYGGLNAIDYLALTKQWGKIEKMIPKMDSLVTSFGAELIPEDLINRYHYQFLTYRNLGQTNRAMDVADSVFINLNKAIENERKSKAFDLAALYETREKEAMIRDKDSQLRFVLSAAGGGILLLMVIVLLGYVIIRRRSGKKLREEHRKLVDAYNQLKVANERAEESSRMKTSFMQQISHEIRTPLNVLSGFTQVLTTPDIALDDETRASATKSIVSSSNRIAKLVNKMLELSDISSQRELKCDDRVTAATIAERAIQDSDILRSPQVSFELQTDNDADKKIVSTNRRSAIRALSLLLDNARKFLGSPNSNAEGRVTLRIAIDPQQEYVNFIVEDTGISIPPEEAEHIFDEFVQLNPYYDGLGIGLSVARDLARRIGGNITLDTSYIVGARFVMQLPL